MLRAAWRWGGAGLPGQKKECAVVNNGLAGSRHSTSAQQAEEGLKFVWAPPPPPRPTTFVPHMWVAQNDAGTHLLEGLSAPRNTRSITPAPTLGPCRTTTGNRGAASAARCAFHFAGNGGWCALTESTPSAPRASRHPLSAATCQSCVAKTGSRGGLLCVLNIHICVQLVEQQSTPPLHESKSKPPSNTRRHRHHRYMRQATNPSRRPHHHAHEQAHTPSTSSNTAAPAPAPPAATQQQPARARRRTPASGTYQPSTIDLHTQAATPSSA